METKTILTILTKELGIRGSERGKNFFFLCPFHDDKNPSLSFEKNNQFFKCFSCGFKASSIFVFWAKFKKISMEKTFQQLALLGYVEANLEMKVKTEKERLVETFALVSKIYQNNLYAKDGQASLAYLVQVRQLPEQLIAQFTLGTALSSKQLTSLFLDPRHHYRKSELAESHLFQIIADKEPYDYFWKRQIIFPIKNEKGEVVIFASRRLEETGESKYIFSPNNPLATKSSIIYNYDVVKEERSDHCYLVEGFFDVMSLTKLGLTNCLSLLGTSITKEQVSLLKRLAKKVIIFLDGDKAGIQATIKIAIILTLNNIECEVIENGSDQDPDELCKNENNDIFKIIKRTISPFLFVINYYYQTFEVEENHQRVGNFIMKVAAEFSQFRNDTQAFIIRKISILTRMSIAEVEKIYLIENNAKTEIKIIDQENENLSQVERAALYYCCRDRSTWSYLEGKGVMFFGKSSTLAYEKISDFYKSNQLATSFDEFEKDPFFSGLHFSEINKRIAIEKILEAVANFKNPVT